LDIEGFDISHLTGLEVLNLNFAKKRHGTAIKSASKYLSSLWGINIVKAYKISAKQNH